MARQGRWSLLRRRGSPAGGLALLCVVLAVPAQAAPSPDPPPAAVAPEPPPVRYDTRAPVRSAPATVAPTRPTLRRSARRAHPAGQRARGEAEAGREGEAEGCCATGDREARHGHTDAARPRPRAAGAAGHRGTTRRIGALAPRRGRTPARRARRRGGTRRRAKTACAGRVGSLPLRRAEREFGDSARDVLPRGSAGASGWFVSNVTVSWTIRPRT